MGISTITVAVLEIHIDRKAEAIMKPSTMRAGCPPTVATMVNATRLWKPEAWRPRASRKPPRNRKTVARP